MHRTDRPSSCDDLITIPALLAGAQHRENQSMVKPTLPPLVSRVLFLFQSSHFKSRFLPGVSCVQKIN